MLMIISLVCIIFLSLLCQSVSQSSFT